MTRPGRVLVPATVALAIVIFLTQVHAVLLPFVLSAALAYLLNPFVVWFEIRGVRRRPAAFVVFIVCSGVFAAVLLGGLGALAREATRLAHDAPALMQWGKNSIDMLSLWARKFPLWGEISTMPWVAHWETEVPQWMTQAIEKMPALALHMWPIFETAFLIPFLTFLFMTDGLRARDKLFEMVPAAYVEMLLGLLVEIDDTLGNYLRGLLTQATVIGFLAGVGFSLIGLHYAAQISLWVGLSSMVPYLGAFSAALVGSFVALGQWGTAGGLLKVLGICAGLRFVDDWIVQPLIFRHAVQIHPAATIFALMAGSTLFGFWGLLFAVPVICMLQALWDVLWHWYRSEYGLRLPATLPEISRIPLI